MLSDTLKVASVKQDDCEILKKDSITMHAMADAIAANPRFSWEIVSRWLAKNHMVLAEEGLAPQVDVSKLKPEPYPPAADVIATIVNLYLPMLDDDLLDRVWSFAIDMATQQQERNKANEFNNTRPQPSYR